MSMDSPSDAESIPVRLCSMPSFRECHSQLATPRNHTFVCASFNDLPVHSQSISSLTSDIVMAAETTPGHLEVPVCFSLRPCCHWVSVAPWSASYDYGTVRTHDKVDLAIVNITRG